MKYSHKAITNYTIQVSRGRGGSMIHTHFKNLVEKSATHALPKPTCSSHENTDKQRCNMCVPGKEDVFTQEATLTK